MRVESHVGAVGTWHTKTHMGKEQGGMHAWAAWALGGVCHHPAGGEKRGRERIPSPHIMQGEDIKEGKQMCRCNTQHSGRDMILAIGLKPTEAGGQGKHGMGCLLEERRT